MTTTAPAPHAIDLAPTRRAAGPPRRHLAWLAVGVIVSFVLPYVLADRLGLPRDLYYGLYGAGVLALCAGWIATPASRCASSSRAASNWRSVSAFSPPPLPWRSCSRPRTRARDREGSSWPALSSGAGSSTGPSTVCCSRRSRSSWCTPPLGEPPATAQGGFAAVAAIALAASLLFTATYHLGYGDFRSAKVRKPVTGDLIWAAPVIATANPIGAPIAHAGLHVAAVTHSYETDLFLPPH